MKRDCSTCKAHRLGYGLDKHPAQCQDCTFVNDFKGWTDLAIDCNTCDNHVQSGSMDDQPPVCHSCSSNKIEFYHWKPISVCKSYDATFREDNRLPVKMTPKKEASDGSTANYYKLPDGAKELQDLISYRNMNAQVGEMFRACYRLGEVSHSPRIRDLKKIIFYAEMEIQRIEKYGE